jgi:hypothetical protein
MVNDRCPLLFIGLATGFHNAQFGSGSGAIFLDEVRCVGNESRLIDCPANAIGDHDCIHSEDAGVQCAISKQLHHVSLIRVVCSILSSNNMNRYSTGMHVLHTGQYTLNPLIH